MCCVLSCRSSTAWQTLYCLKCLALSRSSETHMQSRLKQGGTSMLQSMRLIWLIPEGRRSQRCMHTSRTHARAYAAALDMVANVHASTYIFKKLCSAWYAALACTATTKHETLQRHLILVSRSATRLTSLSYGKQLLCDVTYDKPQKLIMLIHIHTHPFAPVSSSCLLADSGDVCAEA